MAACADSRAPGGRVVRPAADRRPGEAGAVRAGRQPACRALDRAQDQDQDQDRARSFGRDSAGPAPRGRRRQTSRALRTWAARCARPFAAARRREPPRGGPAARGAAERRRAANLFGRGAADARGSPPGCFAPGARSGQSSPDGAPVCLAFLISMQSRGDLERSRAERSATGPAAARARPSGEAETGKRPQRAAALCDRDQRARPCP